MLADALGHDVRIGRRFLNAGLGFSGWCLPKDIRALIQRSTELGAMKAAALLQQVDEINMSQRLQVIDLAIEACGGSVRNRRIGILGTAFKSLTDDVRDSPAPNVAAALHLRDAQVTVYDPEATETAQRMFPTPTYADSLEEAAARADAMLLLTEWDEFRASDPIALGAMLESRVIIDERNCPDATVWRAAGWSFTELGASSSRSPVIDGVGEALTRRTAQLVGSPGG